MWTSTLESCMRSAMTVEPLMSRVPPIISMEGESKVLFQMVTPQFPTDMTRTFEVAPVSVSWALS